MKHLIPYLQDDQKAADYLRQLRWPDGIQCPRCGSDAVEPRERCDNGLQRFNCLACAVRLGQQGSHVVRDSLVSVMYSTELNSTTSSGIPQRTDRHEILDEKPSDFQRLS